MNSPSSSSTQSNAESTLSSSPSSSSSSTHSFSSSDIKSSSSNASSPPSPSPSSSSSASLTNPTRPLLITSGLISGVICAGVFNFYDRALYLSVVHHRPFLSPLNFDHPLRGLYQSMVHRTLSGGLYFPLFDVFHSALQDRYNLPANSIVIHFAAGNLAGGVLGIFLNQLTSIKYASWESNLGFTDTAMKMWRQGGFQPFFKGIVPTVLRDTIFGGSFAICKHIVGSHLPSGRQYDFFAALIGGAVGTALSSPMNYVRNMKYSWKHTSTPPGSLALLSQLLHECRQEPGIIGFIDHLRDRLRVGWGTLRVALGMAVGLVIYESCKDFMGDAKKMNALGLKAFGSKPAHAAPMPVVVASHSSEVDSHLIMDVDRELSDKNRLLSATYGSLLTSLVVTPFEVVKTRLQSQLKIPTNQSSIKFAPTLHMVPGCSHVKMHTGTIDLWCPKCNFDTNTTKDSKKPSFSTTRHAFIQLVKFDGPAALWRGLTPTLLHSVPNTVIYFWAYDKLKLYIHSQQPSSPFMLYYTPLIAGVFSRSLSTIIVSPIELIKTKSQSQPKEAVLSPRIILLEEINRGGFFSLWRGAVPTLWRDVPFSAIYWSLYETFKVKSQQYYLFSSTSPFWLSFMCGASSGLVAAFFTHPFDLIKTRKQIQIYALREEESIAASGNSSKSPLPNPSTWTVYKSIVREEGYKGLTSGLSARLGKIIPACAIMISTYEMAKSKFGERQHKQQRQQNQHGI